MPDSVKPKKRRPAVPHGAGRRVALENLVMLLSAGVDAAAALAAASATAPTTAIKKRLDGAGEAVNAGTPLWQSLTDQGLLTTHQAWLVRVGEESGTLAEHMTTAVEHERREESFRRRLTSALLYPVIVTSIAIIVGLGVAWFILPRLVTVFGALRVTLPLPTRVLLQAGSFLSQNGFWAVPAAALLGAIVGYLLFFAPSTRWIGQTILLHVPGFGKLIKEVEIARFGTVTGSLLNAGVPVPEAFGALADAAAFHPYPGLYNHIHVRIVAGQTVQEALKAWPNSRKFLPPTVQEILSIAEQTGQLARASQQVGQAYELRLETTTKDLIAILEPMMLFGVWLGVVGLAAAIITPIYSVLQGVRQ